MSSVPTINLSGLTQAFETVLNIIIQYLPLIVSVGIVVGIIGYVTGAFSSITGGLSGLFG